jgi:hypothetical protein
LPLEGLWRPLLEKVEDRVHSSPRLILREIRSLCYHLHQLIHVRSPFVLPNQLLTAIMHVLARRSTRKCSWGSAWPGAGCR